MCPVGIGTRDHRLLGAGTDPLGYQGMVSPNNKKSFSNRTAPRVGVKYNI